MKLVLIHGRSQGHRSEAELRDEWIKALLKGYEAAGVSEPGELDVRVPFYGKALDDLTEARRAEISEVVERGTGNDDAIDQFLADLVDEMRRREGITDAEIRAEIGAEAQEKGPANWEWVHAAGRLLSSRIPWLTESILARWLADVDTYLKFPDDINAIVRMEIEGDAPVVVVGHSLGTVVGYCVLTELADKIAVPLYVTLGSPLGITTIKQRLRPPIERPAGVSSWLNAADERDGVALYSRLDRDSFCAGIDNLSDLHNPKDRPHWIGGYLADPEVAKEIAAALTSSN